jgi:hypothetical protein
MFVSLAGKFKHKEFNERFVSIKKFSSNVMAVVGFVGNQPQCTALTIKKIKIFNLDGNFRILKNFNYVLQEMMFISM